MTAWKLAMLLALIPALVPQQGRWSRVRVWGAMFIASLATWLHYSMWYYLAIDALAVIVIAYPPRNVWQKAIGMTFIGMLLLTIGYVISGLQIFSRGAAEPYLLQDAYTWLGWVALALFVLWTLDDALRPYLDRGGDSGHLSPNRVDMVP